MGLLADMRGTPLTFTATAAGSLKVNGYERYSANDLFYRRGTIGDWLSYPKGEALTTNVGDVIQFYCSSNYWSLNSATIRKITRVGGGTWNVTGDLTSLCNWNRTPSTNYCFYGLFSNMPFLTLEIVLPITNTYGSQLDNLFYAVYTGVAPQVQYLEVDFKEWPNATNWFLNPRGSGIFVKPKELPEERGPNRIPEGWTVINRDVSDYSPRRRALLISQASQKQDIITKNLIFHIDGNNNTGMGYQDTSSAEWVDLVGGNNIPCGTNGTLNSNLQWDPGCLSKISSSDIGKLTQTATAIYSGSPSQSYTADVVYKIPQSSGQAWVLNMRDLTLGDSQSLWQIVKYTPSSTIYANTQVLYPGSSVVASAKYIHDDAVMHVTIVGDAVSNTTKIYLNAEETILELSNLSAAPCLCPINQKLSLFFGGWSNGSLGCQPASVYAVRLYDRALTPEEIAFNHEHDVLQYGARETNPHYDFVYDVTADENSDTTALDINGQARVDWGDGAVTETHSAVSEAIPTKDRLTHTYAEYGTYTITVRGISMYYFARLCESGVTAAQKNMITRVRKFPQATMRLPVFPLCTKLAAIDENSGLSSMTVYGTKTAPSFLQQNYSLTTLPSDFNFPPSITTLTACFYYETPVTALPEGFRFSPNVTSISWFLRSTHDLTHMPADLQLPYNCTVADTAFSSINLEFNITNFFHPGWATSNKTINLVGMFRSASKITGTAPANLLWNSGNTFTSTECFSGCTNLTNYPQIPPDWGGGAISFSDQVATGTELEELTYSPVFAANGTKTWSYSGVLPVGITMASNGVITVADTVPAGAYNIPVTLTNDWNSTQAVITVEINPVIDDPWNAPLTFTSLDDTGSVLQITYNSTSTILPTDDMFYRYGQAGEWQNFLYGSTLTLTKGQTAQIYCSSNSFSTGTSATNTRRVYVTGGQCRVRGSIYALQNFSRDLPYASLQASMSGDAQYNNVLHTYLYVDAYSSIGLYALSQLQGSNGWSTTPRAQEMHVRFKTWPNATNQNALWLREIVCGGTFFKPSILPTEFGGSRIPECWDVVEDDTLSFAGNTVWDTLVTGGTYLPSYMLYSDGSDSKPTNISLGSEGGTIEVSFFIETNIFGEVTYRLWESEDSSQYLEIYSSGGDWDVIFESSAGTYTVSEALSDENYYIIRCVNKPGLQQVWINSTLSASGTATTVTAIDNIGLWRDTFNYGLMPVNFRYIRIWDGNDALLLDTRNVADEYQQGKIFNMVTGQFISTESTWNGSWDYSRDRLHFQLDGLNNTNSGHVDTTSTTWVDLVGGNNITDIPLANYAWTGGGLNKPAAATAVLRTTSNIWSTGGAATIEVCYAIQSESQRNIWIAHMRPATATSCYWQIARYASTSNYLLTVPNTVSYGERRFLISPDPATLTSPVTVAYTVRYRSDVFKSACYLNGENLGVYNDTVTNAAAYFSRTPAVKLALFGWLDNATGNGGGATIYAVRIYNRVLSGTELKTNAMLDQLRFNAQ